MTNTKEFEKTRWKKTWERKAANLEKKWKDGFKPLGKPGAVKNSIAVEYNGKVYDSLSAASRATGRSIGYIKKHSKELN